MYKKVKQFIATHNLVRNNDTIIVGLSGGPDSVFLLHFLATLQKELSLTLIVAHLNHEWRPQADQEEQLCREIAHTLGLPFVTSKISQLCVPFKSNGSKEEYARKIRRYFFEKLAQEHNADSIALAHHLDDQKETFFIRLIRGSSLTGLTAINARNGLYIRPLLETSKHEILDWLHAHTITYAIDASNTSDLYLRNRIRSHVIPALQSCDDRFDTNFLTTLNRLKQTEHFLQRLTTDAFTHIATRTNNAWAINTAQLSATDVALHHRIIIHWLIAEHVPFPTTQSFFDELLRFLFSEKGGTHTIHPQWAIIKKQKSAHIVRMP